MAGVKAVVAKAETDPHNHGVRYFPPTLVPSPGDPQCLTTNTEQCSTLSSDTNFHPPLRCCQGSSSQCQDPITPSDFCSPSKGFQNGSKFCCLQYQAYSDALQAQGPHMITLVLLLLILQRILNGAPGA
ncbi:unnamed protein product (mitochondrion) [Plasmodiophora brassicae]|uniref:Uncharacterized protein n=1 Tax=Plasmodiophora brassicae TaxID=37360 RepID=A0A3P3Y3C4_PLABS|nr:unnamed protein product [Plasmodiophora brassicae]